MEPAITPRAVETPKVSVGPTTILGVLVTIVGIVGGIWAAIESQDWATAASGVVAALAVIGTLGGRYAQAVAAIHAGAATSGPIIDALQDAFAVHGPEDEGVVGDDVTDSELHGEPQPIVHPKDPMA